jgi:ADP-ribose pyrophosphatase YjhB (NUDIX family)
VFTDPGRRKRGLVAPRVVVHPTIERRGPAAVAATPTRSNGLWALPGGGMDLGDSIVAAALLMINEEVEEVNTRSRAVTVGWTRRSPPGLGKILRIMLGEIFA